MQRQGGTWSEGTLRDTLALEIDNPHGLIRRVRRDRYVLGGSVRPRGNVEDHLVAALRSLTEEVDRPYRRREIEAELRRSGVHFETRAVTAALDRLRAENPPRLERVVHGTYRLADRL